MENIAYYNGKIALIEEMTIPMNDRSSYFGDGVYDATYTRNHIPFALEEHIDRIYRSAALLKISVPMPKDEMNPAARAGPPGGLPGADALLAGYPRHRHAPMPSQGG